MTVPATVSVTVAVVGLLFALLSLGMSSAPGSRELRWFALASAAAALYAATSVVDTLAVSDAVILRTAHLSLFFGGVHLVAWFLYAARWRGVPLGRVDRVAILGGSLLALLALVPGALYSPELVPHGEGWLGCTYRSASPTWLGRVCYAFFVAALLVVLVRFARQWRAGVPGGRAHFFGLGLLVLAVAHDSLTSAGVLDHPYLIDLGFLAVVGAVGGAVTTRFVNAARALEESSRRLEQTQAELVKRERLAALGELSAVVAHEVRNPLGVLFNCLAALRRSVNHEHAPLLAMMSEEAERLNRMVGDLLEVARPHEPRLALVSPNRLLAGAVEAARSASPEQGADIRIVDPVSLPSLHADEEMLRRALINLIANALQSPERKGPVRVRAGLEAEPPTRVRFEVVDDGAGVPPELADRIFTPFFTTRAAGTGLGLAVVRRVAESHRGTVSVRSTPGGGATFALSLPVAPEESPPEGRAPVRPRG